MTKFIRVTFIADGWNILWTVHSIGYLSNSVIDGREEHRQKEWLRNDNIQCTFEKSATFYIYLMGKNIEEQEEGKDPNEYYQQQILTLN